MAPTSDPLAERLGIDTAPIPELADAAWSRMLQLATCGQDSDPATGM
ncbi:hypothetical protein HT102_01335 [Hoyosella sp. G463]|uniref:Uncharacterized protein n=1 Tax=Lolliginicoccus lacisalsi TaxID=2742202 RepID=A0A927J9F6_9ACTN|nr:hypothetical protein [Lolliginicoccus lacisalsi]MBD8505133.1 hypothetical protein [Lolliginicoccus lacisalsi]